MKKNFLKITSIVLLLMLVLSACGPVETPSIDDTDVSTEVATSEEIEEIVETTTEETSAEVYIERPDKEIKNILMIGNSFCYYYVEELYGIAAADGYELNVANLYESGCPVSDHWLWLLGNKSMYQFYVTNKTGRKQITDVTTSKGALAYADWDVITLQQHFHPGRATNYDLATKETANYSKKLFDYMKKNHSNALLYWHQTWAYEVGYAVAENYVGEPKVDTPIADVATQTLSHETIKRVSEEIAKENEVPLIPCGDAWQIARADARVGDHLCTRKGTNGDRGDFYHDGDIGGGQYLNACVWYEVLMGESCIGNTWRPKNYHLSEEKITALQEAAHEAVAAIYGPGYAK